MNNEMNEEMETKDDYFDHHIAATLPGKRVVIAGGKQVALPWKLVPANEMRLAANTLLGLSEVARDEGDGHTFHLYASQAALIESLIISGYHG